MKKLNRKYIKNLYLYKFAGKNLHLQTKNFKA